VDILIEELLGLIEELTGDDDSGGGAVTDFLLLRLADLDDHVGRRVVDVHLLQDGDAVVRDDDGPAGVDEHLVHPPGPSVVRTDSATALPAVIFMF